MAPRPPLVFNGGPTLPGWEDAGFGPRPPTEISPVRFLAGALLAVVTTTTTTLRAAPFTSGDIVVYRVGTGTGALVNTGNPVFLDEFTPADALVQSTAAAAGSGGNAPLIASGTATSEGPLTRSADGRFLTLTGYGVATPGGSASSLPATASGDGPARRLPRPALRHRHL